MIMKIKASMLPAVCGLLHCFYLNNRINTHLVNKKMLYLHLDKHVEQYSLFYYDLKYDG
jgi:hypothetical protein